MKTKLTLAFLLLAGSMSRLPAAEQRLIEWDHTWQYFFTQSDDPTADDPAIPDAGGGVAPFVGPDLIYTGMNTGVGSWFAKKSDFEGPNGYKTLFGKGFNIDGVHVGDINNYSSYDGGEGIGPLGYDIIDYFNRGLELSSLGTTLTKTPTMRRFAAYFRTTFTAAQNYNRPRLRMLLDDNAVIYYDGVPIAYVNRSNAAITNNDVAGDTTATNNEDGVSGNDENVIQSFYLDVAGGPGIGTPDINAQADSFVISPVSQITAGEHTIAIILRNSGNDSSDMCLGLQLYGNDAGISAVVNSVSRQTGADLIDPADDTFTASVTVTKLGTASTEWTSDIAPSVPGPYLYNTAYTFGPFSAASPVTVTFTATGDPSLTAQAVLTAPPAPAVVGTNTLPGDPVIRISTAYSPWTQMPGLPADRRIQLNSGNALAGIITDPIALTPGTPKCVILSLDYNDASAGSNAETADSIKVEIVTNVGTINLTSAYDADGTSTNNGAAMNGDDTLLESDELNPDSFPRDWMFTAHWLLAGVVPANATTVQIRISAINDSATETLRLGDIQLLPCADSDGDGVLDVFELVQGTDPADPASIFREVGHARAAGSASITVTSSTTRTYAFESSTDLLMWNRDVVPGIPPQTFEANTPGTGANLTLTRTNADPARLFWRAKVHLPSTDISSP